MNDIELHYIIDEGTPPETLKLALHNYEPYFKKTATHEAVYQYGTYYKYIIHLDYGTRSVKRIAIIIHETEIDCTWQKGIDNFTITIIPNEKKPFSRIFGITDICIRLELTDDSIQYLFTDNLLIAVKESNKTNENMQSLKQMIRFIIIENESLLYKRKFIENSAQLQSFPAISSGINDQINYLKEIVNTLKINLPSFFHKAKTIPVPNLKIDSFDKLRTIDINNLTYIVTHPEHLHESFDGRGININTRQMIPSKTLISRNTLSKDNIENRTILSFIYTLVLQVKKIRGTILHQNTTNSSEIQLQNGYILCLDIINQLINETCSKYLKEIEYIDLQLKNLFSQYKEALPCDYTLIKKIPSPRPAFFEIFHYRRIYECMISWFGYNTTDIAENKFDYFRFFSADAIYEYFCLLTIKKLLVDEFGFSEEFSKNENFNYGITHQNQHEKYNTFYFIRKDCQLVLYYQPVIFSDSRLLNGISLIRCDHNGLGQRPYYMPDFLIKKTSNSNSTYAILDAKWSRISSLKENTQGGTSIYSQTMHKYVNGIIDVKSQKTASLFWLISGINENTKIFRHNISPNCHLIPQIRNATGIFTLTPDSGFSYCKEILASFLRDFH